MSEARRKGLRSTALGYGVLSFLLIVIALLPIQAPSDEGPVAVGDRIMITGTVAPDLVLVITLAWLARRPDQLSSLVLLVVFLFRDLATGAPPGMDALAILAVAEIMRARHSALREAGFLMEWAMAAMMVIAFTFFEGLIAAILFLPTPPLSGLALAILLNIALYPLFVAFLVWAFGLRKTAPGSLDETGHRI